MDYFQGSREHRPPTTIVTSRTYQRSTKDYVSEAERHLNDSAFYNPLDHDPTLEIAKQVSDTIREMHDQGHLSEKNMAYLIVDQPKAC